MKDIPEKFLNALKKLINKDSKESEQTAERIAHHIGTQTGPIKFK